MTDINIEVDNFIGFINKHSSLEWDMEDPYKEPYLKARIPDEIFKEVVDKFWPVLLIADIWYDAEGNRVMSFFIPKDKDNFYEE